MHSAPQGQSQLAQLQAECAQVERQVEACAGPSGSLSRAMLEVEQGGATARLVSEVRALSDRCVNTAAGVHATLQATKAVQ